MSPSIKIYQYYYSNSKIKKPPSFKDTRPVIISVYAMQLSRVLSAYLPSKSIKILKTSSQKMFLRLKEKILRLHDLK
jgi:hypothetical protein